MLRWHSGTARRVAILQAPDDQVQQPESEFGVLEIQFLELVVVDARGLHDVLAQLHGTAQPHGREQPDSPTV